MLDLSRQNTEIKRELEENQADDDEDSADNLDDIDEKAHLEQSPEDTSSAMALDGQKTLLRNTQVTPTSGIQTNVNLREELARANKNNECLSDGENVDVDEDEMQTKAFEARESQWNRKLSIKHSEEKRVN